MRSILAKVALPVVVASAALSFAACSHGPHVQAAIAPGFAAGGHGVSIVGVMKDGRLNPEAWSWIGAELSRPFGPSLCQAAFRDELQREDPTLFAFADKEAKQNGVTESLLDEFAARAKGDLLLVVELWGEPPQKRPGVGGAPAPMGTPGAPAYGGGSGIGAAGMGPRGMATPQGPQARMRTPGEDGSYGLAVSVYAPKTKQWVAAAKVTDAGTASDEGVRRVADELARMLPGATCAGWSFEAGAASAPASASGAASAAASASVR